MSFTKMSVLGAIETFERDVDFMTFFYQHLTSCPPHGPFRLYSALTLVERARRRVLREIAQLHRQQRLDSAAVVDSSQNTDDSIEAGKRARHEDGNVKESNNNNDNNNNNNNSNKDEAHQGDALTPSTYTTPDGLSAVLLRERRRLLDALTPHNVLALMERRYNTNHLSGWPLMYVPAEVHAGEIATVMAEQQQLQQQLQQQQTEEEETARRRRTE